MPLALDRLPPMIVFWHLVSPSCEENPVHERANNKVRTYLRNNLIDPFDALCLAQILAQSESCLNGEMLR